MVGALICIPCATEEYYVLHPVQHMQQGCITMWGMCIRCTQGVLLLQVLGGVYATHTLMETLNICIVLLVTCNLLQGMLVLSRSLYTYSGYVELC